MPGRVKTLPPRRATRALCALAYIHQYTRARINWKGRRDSNPRCQVESLVSLPLDDGPTATSKIRDLGCSETGGAPENRTLPTAILQGSLADPARTPLKYFSPTMSKSWCEHGVRTLPSGFTARCAATTLYSPQACLFAEHCSPAYDGGYFQTVTLTGRGGWIRTTGLLLPRQAL